jgi:hypothetical protein
MRKSMKVEVAETRCKRVTRRKKKPGIRRAFFACIDPGHPEDVVTRIDVGHFARHARGESEHRNAATLPTSSIVTLRRSGAYASTWPSILRKFAMPAAASVLIGPAEIALTRVPSGRG